MYVGVSWLDAVMFTVIKVYKHYITVSAVMKLLSSNHHGSTIAERSA